MLHLSFRVVCDAFNPTADSVTAFVSAVCGGLTARLWIHTALSHAIALPPHPCRRKIYIFVAKPPVPAPHMPYALCYVRIPVSAALTSCSSPIHPGGDPRENLKSISHRCYLFEVAFAWDLTQETIVLPLGCLQGGLAAAHSMRAPQGCRMKMMIPS